MSSYLFFLLILACPLAMIFMMRGRHGGHGRDADAAATTSLEELRRQRERLDHEIEERETAETPTPIGGSRR